MRFVITLAFLCLQLIAFAQTCTIIPSRTTVCIGNTVTFTVSVSSGTPQSYSWNFGDLTTSTQSVVVHTYLSTGTFTPTITVNLQGGGSCQATGPAITVVPLPQARFSVLSPDTLCYKNNQLCINDQSIPGGSNAPIAQRVFQLNNGHIQIDQAPFSSSTICYNNTTDFFGRLYTILLEVTDTNGCVARRQVTDSIYLLPRNQPISFGLALDPGCDSSRVVFTNTSLFPVNRARSFYWIFGDGGIDSSSSRWTNFARFYKQPGVYSPRLVVKDVNNCIDTFTLPNSVTHTGIDSTIRLESLSTQTNKFCHSGQVWKISNESVGLKRWQIIKNNRIIDSAFGDIISNTIPDQYVFKDCGTYTIRLTINFANCLVVRDTTITILGPISRIETDTARIFNKNQCEPHDTIRFRTPLPEMSCFTSRASTKFFWDFDNANALPCTTDTKNGVNVGVNCRYSLDETFVRHYYNQEGCYRPRLLMTDTLSGCLSGDTVSISIGPPDAGWDSTSNPVRPGLTYQGQPCLRTILDFDFTKLLPSCGFERAWVNWDTACNPSRWILLDTNRAITIEQNAYGNFCNPNGNVVVGLVLRNGLDRNGNHCYDTAYYPFFKFIPKNPWFDFRQLNSCAPFRVRFNFIDSVQPQLKSARWTINRVLAGNTIVPLFDTVMQLNGDSVLPSITATLPRNGLYQVRTGLTDNEDCTEAQFETVPIGFNMAVSVDNQINCVNQPFALNDFVRYYNLGFTDFFNPRNYWAESDRVSAGKEMLWWDIGDGRGFATTGSSPVVSYSKPGTYTIRLVARDSLGCLDTLTLPNFINIIQVKARAWVQDSVFLCAPQIVVFRDSSQFVDEFGNVDPLTPDAIRDWYWDFNDNKQPRILPNPAHNFTSNGTFNVMMVVTTDFGCIDTAYRTITLRGPAPSFTIDDTLGCAPFTAVFRNTTGQQLLSWTWRFGDSSNTILSTNNDSTVQFVYTQPGIYSVRLIGIDTLTNPNTGNLLTCTAIFPDTTTGVPTRDIYVEFTPPIELFAPDTICPDEEVVFTVSANPIYDQFNWFFTSTDSTESLFPDTVQRFTYTAAGIYPFMMIPSSLTQTLLCADTLRKDMVVQDIEADFELDRQQGRQYTFANRSRAATRYEWYLGKENIQNPFSTEQNPTYTYPGDSVFFNICLVAYNDQDCWDSICKEYTFFADIKIYNVFTPGNNDNVNDAFDIDIQGEKKYHLRIYNRWGGLVFEGFEDGEGNDGKNWNGLINNTGDECAAGVYYYIFTYQFLTDTEDRSINGTITLIRK